MLHQRLVTNVLSDAVALRRQDEIELALFETADYQAISKARLWREIFFLRQLVEEKTKVADSLATGM